MDDFSEPSTVHILHKKNTILVSFNEHVELGSEAMYNIEGESDLEVSQCTCPGLLS